MDVIGLVLGLITTPITWPIALLILVAISLMKGWIIPRSQSDALIVQHDKVEDGLRDTITLIREDRDSSLEALRVERDLWRSAAKESQEVAQEVRSHNGQLIKRQEALDHLITELRRLTGIGDGTDDG